MESTIDELRETSAELDEIIDSIEENGATAYDERKLRSIGNELVRHVDEGLPEDGIEEN